ncbi:hypothetical protein [Pseudarthrobacter sp. fls2-241-R2A-127]|uniref:hypothetical protein n=1 Tax=Pseudarthrobacter sp. fls2-241-R2A-127 TaxID=3040303 RepID=UPI002554FC83|nr:hypothetical protein [Pseudarthrobacter sp. fls2-241-R2A-127]
MSVVFTSVEASTNEPLEPKEATEMFTQHITIANPATQQVSHHPEVRRGDTVALIARVAGEVEAKEFFAEISENPDRIAPYVSSSGNVVVVFSAKPDPRNEWPATFSVEQPEPEKPVRQAGKQLRRRCLECGKESTAAAMGYHMKSSGHTGLEDVA